MEMIADKLAQHSTETYPSFVEALRTMAATNAPGGGLEVFRGSVLAIVEDCLKDFFLEASTNEAAGMYMPIVMMKFRRDLAKREKAGAPAPVTKKPGLLGRLTGRESSKKGKQ